MPEIHVKDLLGTTYTWKNVTSSDTIADLKKWLHDKHYSNLRTDEMRIIANGQIPADDENALFVIGDGGTAHMIMRLRGGEATTGGRRKRRKKRRTRRRRGKTRTRKRRRRKKTQRRRRRRRR